MDRPGASPPGGVVVDLLFASSGIEPEVVISAELLEVLPGLTDTPRRLGEDQVAGEAGLLRTPKPSGQQDA